MLLLRRRVVVDNGLRRSRIVRLLYRLLVVDLINAWGLLVVVQELYVMFRCVFFDVIQRIVTGAGMNALTSVIDNLIGAGLAI